MVIGSPYPDYTLKMAPHTLCHIQRKINFYSLRLPWAAARSKRFFTNRSPESKQQPKQQNLTN